MWGFWTRQRQKLAGWAKGQDKPRQQAMVESLRMFVPMGADEMVARPRPKPVKPAPGRSRATGQPNQPAASQPVRVVINPGHAPGAGGAPGAHINEADATGWIGDIMPQRSDDRVVWERLRQQGRDRTALLSEARTNKRQIMVSLHFDAGSATSRRATIIYWSQDPDPVRLANSQRLGDSVGAALVQQGACDSYVLQPAPYARGSDPDFLPGIVCDTATDAAILVEAGFITNPQTEAALQSEQGQQRVADGLHQGVGNYLGGPPAPRPAPAQTRPAPAGRSAPSGPARPAPTSPAPAPPPASTAPTPPPPPRDRNGRRGH